MVKSEKKERALKLEKKPEWRAEKTESRSADGATRGPKWGDSESKKSEYNEWSLSKAVRSIVRKQKLRSNYFLRSPEGCVSFRNAKRLHKLWVWSWDQDTHMQVERSSTKHTRHDNDEFNELRQSQKQKKRKRKQDDKSKWKYRVKEARKRAVHNNFEHSEKIIWTRRARVVRKRKDVKEFKKSDGEVWKECMEKKKETRAR